MADCCWHCGMHARMRAARRRATVIWSIVHHASFSYCSGWHAGCCSLHFTTQLPHTDTARALPTYLPPPHTDKIVAAVCHGPAGLLNALGPAGESIISGRRVTGFTDSEEKASGKQGCVPFSLEQRMVKMGGVFERGESDWGEYAVRDGHLVTGQNPASSERVASLAVEVLTAPEGSMPDPQ
jgi:hypothetical protein